MEPVVKVSIHCSTRKEPLQISEPGDGPGLLAENLLVAAAQYCGLTPKVAGIFGLFNPALGLWHSPGWRIRSSSTLHFRLRFRPPTAQVLMNIDAEAFDYYFHQAREEVLEAKIPELSQHQNEVLGLVATDIIREIIETGKTPESYSFENMERFLPKEIYKSLLKFYIKPMLETAVGKGWANSCQNLGYVKREYINLLHKTVPEYGFETYTVLYEQGSVWEVEVVINPFSADHAGVRMTTNNKERTIQLFAIEDICFINCRRDLKAEISHKNGCPSHFQFRSREQMHSFITALDGYFRLLEKWNFNLCPEVETPSLVQLRKLRAHGPIGLKAAKAKLRTKGQGKAGCYLIRQSRSHFHELRVDLCRGTVTTLVVQQDGDRFLLLRVLGNDAGVSQEFLNSTYDSLEELLRCVFPGKTTCLMPSEYELMPTLIYRKEIMDPPPVQDSKRCVGQILGPDRLKLVGVESSGRFTDTATGELVLEQGTRPEKVFVKWLRRDAAHFLDEWLSEISRKSYWKCSVLVHYFGCQLTQPVSLVMELCPLGPLDVYLRRNHVTEVERVEIVFYLAQALAYLGRLGLAHGKVRCSKILVDSDSDGIRVKLGDSGLLRYSVEDVYWIPPELYHDFSQARSWLPADIWATGVTFWEIFSSGQHPQSVVPLEECQDRFLRGEMLPQPKGCCDGIWRVIQECWAQDHMRKTPSSLIRDINQAIYDVYNTTRYHSYAYPTDSNNGSTHQPTHKLPLTPPPLPPPPPSPSSNKKTSSFLRIFTKKSVAKPPAPKKSFDYRNLSTSSLGSVVSAADTTLTGSTYIHGNLSLEEAEDGQRSRDSWVVDSQQLVLSETLGVGFYGEVFKARLNLHGCEEVVAVKKLRQSSTDMDALENFRSEIELMKKLRHRNIVEIKALVEVPHQMLVMEYVEQGSLLSYLKLHEGQLECPQLLAFAQDVVEGMVYLSQMKIVHRDLATRNILVASDGHVKISDFGLARHVKGDYYRIQSHRNLPIRWYAPESIKFGKFSSKSDVWSWGITLWEMFSGGRDPVLPGVTEAELAVALDGGKRLACPSSWCPLDVYQLMMTCWAQESEERPDFCKLRSCLRDIVDRHCN